MSLEKQNNPKVVQDMRVDVIMDHCYVMRGKAFMDEYEPSWIFITEEEEPPLEQTKEGYDAYLVLKKRE